MRRCSATCLLLVLLPNAAFAQFKQGTTEPHGAQLGQTVVQRWKAGGIVTASGGPCQGIVATFPVPVEWPEQDVKVVN